MGPKEMNQLLLNRFPELKDAFEKETSWQEGLETGATVTYEDVFMPFFIDGFIRGDKEFQNRLLSFVEELSKTPDEYCQNVVGLAILDDIQSYEMVKDKIVNFLLPESRKQYEAIIRDEKAAHI